MQPSQSIGRSLNDEMQAAYDRDYASQRRMRKMRDEIDAFLASDPGMRVRASTLGALKDAVRWLEEDMAAIVRRWE